MLRFIVNNKKMLFPLPINNNNNNNNNTATTTSLSSPPCSIITPPTLTIPRASHSFSYSTSNTRRRNSCNIVYNGKPTCSTNIVNAAAASASVSLLINLDLLDEDEQTLTTTTSGGSSTSVWQRRLILLRHAKSRWPNPSIRDHDRPLDEVGEADAIKVSHKLHQLGWVPDLILSSDARRTRETLKFMQESVREFSEAEVHFIPSFYSVAAMDGQTTEHIRDAICKFSQDGILTVMCMGHNRGWEEAASVLSGTSIELKTCNAALLEGTGKSWEEAFSVAGAGGWKLRGIVTPGG